MDPNKRKSSEKILYLKNFFSVESVNINIYLEKLFPYVPQFLFYIFLHKGISTTKRKRKFMINLHEIFFSYFFYVVHHVSEYCVRDNIYFKEEKNV